MPSPSHTGAKDGDLVALWESRAHELVTVHEELRSRIPSGDFDALVACFGRRYRRASGRDVLVYGDLHRRWQLRPHANRHDVACSSRDQGPLEPGERLFDTGEYREMAMIDYSLTEDRYIVSYREAGEVLTTHVIQGGMSDLLVFPILFAYRHWLELELKSLITLGQR